MFPFVNTPNILLCVILLLAEMWNPSQLSQHLRVLTEEEMEKIEKEEQLWVFKHGFNLFQMPIVKDPQFFGSNQLEHVFLDLFRDVKWHVNDNMPTYTR